MKSGEILYEKVHESPRPIPTSTLKDEPVLGLWWCTRLFFCSMYLFGVCGPCLRVSSRSSGDLE